MTKGKKYQLFIPIQMEEHVHPDLAARQGEVSDTWDEYLMAEFSRWFKEVKPISRPAVYAEKMFMEYMRSPGDVRQLFLIVAEKMFKEGKEEGRKDFTKGWYTEVKTAQEHWDNSGFASWFKPRDYFNCGFADGREEGKKESRAEYEKEFSRSIVGIDSTGGV